MNYSNKLKNIARHLAADSLRTGRIKINPENPFGAFIHGFKASAYWGGTQYWYFFFENWLKMFSIIGIRLY